MFCKESKKIQSLDGAAAATRIILNVLLDVIKAPEIFPSASPSLLE